MKSAKSRMNETLMENSSPLSNSNDGKVQSPGRSNHSGLPTPVRMLFFQGLSADIKASSW